MKFNDYWLLMVVFIGMPWVGILMAKDPLYAFLGLFQLPFVLKYIKEKH